MMEGADDRKKVRDRGSAGTELTRRIRPARPAGPMPITGWVAWMALTAFQACSGSGPSQDDASRADYHYRLARNYYNDRNIAMTQRELHTALTLDPSHAEAHHLKGFVLMGLQNYDGAAAEFRETLRLKPDHFEARNNLGATLIAQDRFDEAIQALTPLVEEPLYPTPALAHYNIGYAYHRIGDRSGARRHLEMALFLAPGMCKAANALGLLLQDIGDAKGAREAFERAVKQCPKFAEPYYHLGVMLQKADDHVSAEAMFARCAEIAPDTTVGRRCKARR